MRRILFLLFINFLAYLAFAQEDNLSAYTRGGSLNFSSSNKDFKYKFTGRLQLDAAYFFDNRALNPIGNGVALRRARFGFKTTLDKRWHTAFTVDFAGAQVELKDMYLQYDLKKSLWIKAGNFKEPFSLHTLGSSKYLMVPERPMVSKLTPSRHPGIEANYYTDLFTVTGGIFFQKISTASEVELTQEHNELGQDEGLSFTQRIAFHPYYDRYSTLHFAVDYSYRQPKTTWEEPDVFSFSATSLSAINTKRYISTGDIPGVSAVNLYDAEAAYLRNNFKLQGEFVVCSVARDDLPDVTLSGYYVQFGYLLLGSLYTYDKKNAVFGRVDLERNKNDVEVTFRYDYLNANDPDAGVYGGSMEGYSFGVNYWATGNVKFLLTYTIVDHDIYANGDGLYFVGYDSNGDKTTDPWKVESGKGEVFGFVNFRMAVFF